MNTYVDLMRCERAMKLSVGGVDHFNHVSLADALHLVEIELDISLFAIFGPARSRAGANVGGHDDYFLWAGQWNKCNDKEYSCPKEGWM